MNSHKNQQHHSDWSYVGNDGPLYWSRNYPCAAGKHQSPIDIDTSSAVYDIRLESNPLFVWYDNLCCDVIKNTGYSFQVTPSGTNTSKVIGGPVKESYKFLQFHMHWSADHYGSEHSVNRKLYPGELHFVNWNSDKYSNSNEASQSNNHDGILVLAVFVEIGNYNIEFEKICKSLHDIAFKNQSEHLENEINPRNLIPIMTSQYWTYNGSLTTPPCFESVKWIVFKSPIQISVEQYECLQSLYTCDEKNNNNQLDCCKMKCNARPVCSLNDRVVYKSFKSSQTVVKKL